MEENFKEYGSDCDLSDIPESLKDKYDDLNEEACLPENDIQFNSD